ncbi:MAG TPA: DUF2124 family protein [Methanocella sp.]|uniref:DUF2124 family protein n=1 Tax=Methanocella sp. TaxID=2052833 RepID=UPI002C4F2641|nr:DUF2124 family protein [Methanocella sp.]HTY89578.1 DUF2124 family protein [Methanocella sp.]
MAYKLIETSRGLSNLLKIFKVQIMALGVQRGSHIVFVGCAGTCLPFIELFAYTLRNDPVVMTFVPDGIIEDARSIWQVPGIGMQTGGAADPHGADFIVLLGGLSMPACTLGIGGSNEVIDKIKKPGAKVMGVCFMSMFEKAGWYGKVPFDLVIDANIEPIQVQKFE